MKIDAIRKRLKNGTLEVEHLLWAAREPSLQLATELEAIAEANGWSATDKFPMVPLWHWVQAISVYCRSGYAGVVDFARDKSMLPFGVGLLEELKSPEALKCLLQISLSLGDKEITDQEIGKRVVAGLNSLGMAGFVSELSVDEQINAREYLHRAFGSANTDAYRFTALCALRYFGDESSLHLMKNCPKLPEVWEQARPTLVRTLAKRIKALNLVD